ncbi:MAG: hypothetical protein GXY34_02630, partial [Syntrophomonadaceae bacterium]|nr:hypothetical protein [Syntrophomonadaceae bacterium]
APAVTGSTPTTDTTPTWSWTAGGGGNGIYRYKLDNNDLSSGATETADSDYTPGSALNEGSHTLYVQERDVVGNWSASGSFVITIDVTPPAAPAVTGSTPTTDTTPTWSWTAGGGGNGTYRYKLDDNDLSLGATETAALNYTPGSALSEGSYTLYVQERDAAGNWSASGSFVITIDNTPPAAPVVTGSTPTTDTTPTWSWTSGGGGGNGIYRYKLDNNDLSSGATETAALAYTPDSALAVGSHTLYVQESDAAGNWSLSGSLAIVTENDTTAPNAGGGGAVTASNATSSTIDLIWSAATDNNSQANKLEYKVVRSASNNISTISDAEANGIMVQDYTTNLTCKQVSGLSASTTYYFNVLVRDEAGNKNIYNTTSLATTAQSDSGGTGGGGSGGNTASVVNTTTGSALIHPNSGGSVALGTEAEVKIPANAIPGNTALSVTVDRVQGPVVPAGFMVLGNVYEMKVAGQSSYQFNQPVTLSFTYDPSLVPPGFSPTIQYYDTDTSQWIDLGGTVSGNTISITTMHFTKYAVMVKKSGEKDPPITPAVKELSDIKGHWAETAIKHLVGMKAITGYPDGTFKTEKAITRAEFTVVLVKALAMSSTTPKSFNDVSGHWAENYISIAAANEIVSGYNLTTFGPNDPITREQMAVMVARAAKLDKKAGASGYVDAEEISSWAKDYINSAVEKKILSVGEDNCFRPKAYASRAEAVMIMYRVLTQ